MKPKVKLQLIETTPSTNDAIKDLFLSGDIDDLSAIQAAKQTAGRGRHGRTWRTISGESVACSILVVEDQAEHLPLLTAVAALQTAKAYLPSAHIKWPNDILVKNKKIAGILIEKFSVKGQTAFVVGLGMNVGSASASFWEMLPQTTSFAREGKDVDVQTVVDLYIQYFAQLIAHYRTHGWDSFLQNLYKENCISYKDTVRWQKSETELIKGTVDDIDAQGRLHLLSEDGTLYVVSSGEIIQ